MVGLGFAVPMIAQAGHLGGLALGSLVGALLSGVLPVRLRWAGWGLVLAGLVGLGVAARAPQWRTNYFAFQGYALLEEGRGAEAVVLLRRALDRAGDAPELQNGVAYALAEAGTELGEAERLVDLALRADPENPDFLDTKGWILCRSGDSAAGLEWVRRASEASEGSVAEIEQHLEACESAWLRQ